MVEVNCEECIYDFVFAPIPEAGYINLYARDITVRKHVEANLQESERKYRELFSSMIEGFALHELIVDDAGKPVDYRFIEANPAFEAMTGLKAEFIAGKTVKEVIPGIEPFWIETYGRVALSGTPITFENYSAPLGRWYQVQVYSPTPGRFATIFSDVSDRKKSETLKDEFIGMISHELKTPLTVVIGALSTAVMQGLPENLRRDLFHDAVIHSEMLASIVDNLLELSRQQSGRIDLHKAPTNVETIACKVVGQLRTKSAIHDVKCEFPETLPLVPADPLRVERILYNLVENAIKYSPAGGEVKTFAEQKDGFLVVGVSDQGIGIAPEKQHLLFQSFERLGAEIKGAIQGTGLGLRVCRILAEAHGGKIWVESAPGKGSTFYFTLPLGNPTRT